MDERKDWVKVQLTAEAAALAGQGEVIIVCGAREWRFRAGEAQEVTRVLDWRFLGSQRSDGVQLLELVKETKQ